MLRVQSRALTALILFLIAGIFFNAAAGVCSIEKTFRQDRCVISYFDFKNKIAPSPKRVHFSMLQAASAALKHKPDF